MNANTVVASTPIGQLTLSESNGYITQCRFGAGDTAPLTSSQASPVLREAQRQLDDYFAGRRCDFDLPLAPVGSAFQEKVWTVLQTIPYGETWSYQQLAGQVGNVNASRAVGSANGKNPIWIIIPCHRVVRTSGELGGYAGGLDVKATLLDLEKQGKKKDSEVA